MVRELTLQEKSDIAYRLEVGETVAAVGDIYGISRRAVDLTQRSYWNRWHQLLTLKDEGNLTEQENREYAKMRRTLERIETVEARRIGQRDAAEIKKSLDSIDKLIAELGKLRAGTRSNK